MAKSHVSDDIEECIRTIAAKHVDVRFVKLNFMDAEMEPMGVPALLAYRGGEKFAGLVPLIQEIPDDADLSAGTIEMVLRRYASFDYPSFNLPWPELTEKCVTQTPNPPMINAARTHRNAQTRRRRSITSRSPPSAPHAPPPPHQLWTPSSLPPSPPASAAGTRPPAAPRRAPPPCAAR